MVNLLEFFALQLLNDESDITEPPDLVQAAQLFTQELESVNAKKFSNVWSVPNGHSLVQLLLQELVQLFSDVFKDYTLVRQALGIPLNHCNPTWLSRFNGFDKEILLGFKWARWNVKLCESGILTAENGLFNTVPLGPNEVVSTYYGTLVYGNISDGASRGPALYGEGDLVVTVKGWMKWGMQLELATPSGCSIWVYPSHLCPARFINDPPYTNFETRRPTMEQLAANTEAYRTANVCYADKSIKRNRKGGPVKDFDNFAFVTRHKVFGVTTTRNINAGDELFSDYGEDYIGGFGSCE